jgi:hypothetical protein
MVDVAHDARRDPFTTVMKVVRRGATRPAVPADATSHPLDVGVRPGPFRAAESAGERANDVEGPLLYTVQEAARELLIGRTLAYQQAELYLATAGSDGIPTIGSATAFGFRHRRC